MAASWLVSILFFLVLQDGTKMTRGDKEEDFFKACPPSKCGLGGLEIRYPLRLMTSPPFCGAQSLILSCSGNDTLLPFSNSSSCKVTKIDYTSGQITINLGDCPLQNHRSINLSSPVLAPFYTTICLVGCSKIHTENSDGMIGPISCLSNTGDYIYAANAEMFMDKLPFDCMLVPGRAEIPYRYYLEWGELTLDLMERGGLTLDFIERGELTLNWSIPEIGDKCKACEAVGKRCAGNEVYCNHGSHVKLVAGIVTGAIVMLVLAALILLYIFRQSDREKETQLKVERFLAMYKTTKPARYTFVEVRKMTRRFKHKLGQGGFGSVYKGELPNGIPVAVKMLEKSKGEGEEFINEVATIGRIHHVNVVRLLGFCSERTRHALIYEFMPNESLEKYIYFRENARAHESFCMKMLLEIVEGIARGIEYLHQGCDQRILHFDIKPHNILLDHDFNPKISDFGLAKLCSRDHSLITMTAARGTMGYIAPEMYSRNFGTVSYKSDVHSFGILILEMVSGRKSMDPEIENQDEVYFPEKVYEWIVHGQDLGLDMEMNGGEEEIVKKLAIVALWCIQWNPTDRPSMTRVIQMLIGDLQSLQLPPKPFISSSDQ